MDATKDYVQTHWIQLKPNIRKHWEKITDADLAQMSGKTDELIDVLRRRYGYGKAQAQIEINSWLSQSV